MLKHKMCLHVAVCILNLENNQLQERGVLIVRSLMSKLKFKYSLKPTWIESLKKIIRQNGIPKIGVSLKQIHEYGGTPTMVMRRNPNNLKLANKTLDEYLVEDVIGDHDLHTEVNLLSSDGFLKNSLPSDRESEKNSERFVDHLTPTQTARREVEDKRIWMQRLRIEFTSKLKDTFSC